MKRFTIVLFIAIMVIDSCTPYKQVPYFQDLKRDSLLNERITNYSPLTMQPGDILGINVNSLNHEADLAFNYNIQRDVTPTLGYLIDGEGNIKLPIIDTIKVASTLR